MRKIMAGCLIVFLGVVVSAREGFAQCVAGDPSFACHFGVEEDTVASFVKTSVGVTTILQGNPPLPMSHYEPGRWKMTVLPTYFKVTRPIDGSGLFPDNGDEVRASISDSKGWGGGVGWSYAFKPRWGLYVFGVGNFFEGKVHSGAGEGVFSNGTPDTRDWDGTGSGLALSAGLVHELYKSKDESLSFPVFAGPMFSYYRSKNHFVTTGSDGSLRGDINADGRQTSLGFLFGAQASWNMGKYFNLNPYVVFTPQLSNSTKVKIHINALNDPNPPTPSEFQVGQDYESTFDAVTNNTMLGLNLTYRPWGLGLNVSGFILSAYSPVFAKGVEITKMSLSWSFGNYVK